MSGRSGRELGLSTEALTKSFEGYIEKRRSLEAIVEEMLRNEAAEPRVAADRAAPGR